MDADQAVRLGLQGPAPCVLVDVADNVGGGSPGDSSHLLHAMRRNGAGGSVTVMWDPALVSQVHGGMPSGASHWVGGRSDPSMGPAFELRSTPQCHGPVTYLRSSTYMTGSLVDMGRVAVFHEDIGDVVVTENRVVPFDEDHLTVLGIEPRRARIIVAKGAIAWKAAFGEFARRIHYVNGPGTCPVDVSALPFATRPVPIYPLELDTTWAGPGHSTRKDAIR
jgi:microcystin degradation protein MlrC